jgi:hypothetical protein
VITISNVRHGTPIGDTEALFIPFKGQFENAGQAAAGKASGGQGFGAGGVCCETSECCCGDLSVWLCLGVSQRAGNPSRRRRATSNGAVVCGGRGRAHWLPVAPRLCRCQLPRLAARRVPHCTCRGAGTGVLMSGVGGRAPSRATCDVRCVMCDV